MCYKNRTFLFAINRQFCTSNTLIHRAGQKQFDMQNLPVAQYLLLAP